MKHSTSDKSTQKAIGRASNTATTSSDHGSSTGFNPEARVFVPGASAAVQPKPHHQSPKGTQGDARKSSTKRNSAKEAVGGLSQALRTGSRRSDLKPQPQAARPGPSAGSRAPEASLLGRSPSRNFVSANHLLNFQYERPPERGGGTHAGSSRGRRPPGRSRPQDRTKFLQANFRFLVSDAADLGAAASNPDLMVDWADVLQVEMLLPAPPQCPISLDSPPACAHITPCGHVFSLPALMGHLLHAGGEGLRKAAPCPLCTVPVAARELRMAGIHIITPPKVGDILAFTLVKRKRHGVLAVEAKPGPQPAHFAKFRRVADPDQLWADAAQELAALAAQVEWEGGPDALQELPAIEVAVESLAGRAAASAERHARLAQDAGGTPPDEEAVAEAGAAAAAAVKRVANVGLLSAAEGMRKEVQEKARLSDFPALPGGPQACTTGTEAVAHEPAFSDDDSPRPAAAWGPRSPVPEAPQALAEGSSPPKATSSMPSRADDKPDPEGSGGSEFYFYQASDGQPIFLHPLLGRMLLASVDGYEALPARVEGRLLELETAIQTEQLRKRHRMLSHLPLGGTYALAEIELDGLPSEVVAFFAKEVAARAARREARAREDELQAAKERAREQAEARAAAGPSIQELQAMPLPGKAMARGKPEEQEEALALAEGEEGWPGTSPPPPPPQAGISFAHMAKMGFAASGPALSLAASPPALASPSGGDRGFPPIASSPTGQPVWGGGSAATRLAEGGTIRQRTPPVPPDPAKSSTSHGRRKASKPLVVLGMQNRRY